jgi:hypothetical protein
VVLIDLVTAKAMMETGAGFVVTVDGRSVPARAVGRGKAANGALLTLMVPAGALDGVQGPLIVRSGGSAWNFGPLADIAAP